MKRPMTVGLSRSWMFRPFLQNLKSYYGEPIGSHRRSFEQYHRRPPTAFPSPRLGVRKHTPKLQSLLSQERVKLRTSSFVRTFLVSIGTKPVTNFGKGSRLLVNTLENFYAIARSF